MSENPWFKDWFNSHYYHLLYKHRDDNEAFAFIDKLVSFLNPNKDSLMLDVACGKGRHSKALADKGFDVTGIDLATESIEYANKFAHDKLHFYVHDMRLPFWINYFDVAFNLFTSFGYFKTNRENDNAIRTIASSIKPNGFFVIDYLNVNHSIQQLKANETKEIEDVTFTITRTHDDHHFYKKINIDDKANSITGEAYTEMVTKFSLTDFTSMFQHHNLKIVYVFGDYDLNEYNETDSKRLIIVAKKII